MFGQRRLDERDRPGQRPPVTALARRPQWARSSIQQPRGIDRDRERLCRREQCLVAARSFALDVRAVHEVERPQRGPLGVSEVDDPVAAGRRLARRRRACGSGRGDDSRGRAPPRTAAVDAASRWRTTCARGVTSRSGSNTLWRSTSQPYGPSMTRSSIWAGGSQQHIQIADGDLVDGQRRGAHDELAIDQLRVRRAVWQLQPLVDRHRPVEGHGIGRQRELHRRRSLRSGRDRVRHAAHSTNFVCGTVQFWTVYAAHSPRLGSTRYALVDRRSRTTASTLAAASGMFVPGPKMAATPTSVRNS